jgi:ATP-binding cassette, subfamily C, type I secretion system permease/ATPase
MSLRNAEVVQAMGMLPGLLKRWNRDRFRAIERQVVASDRAATTTSVIRFLRLSMQSLMLGLRAYLVIERLVTVGNVRRHNSARPRAAAGRADRRYWRAMISARGVFERVAALTMRLKFFSREPGNGIATRTRSRFVLDFVRYRHTQRRRNVCVRDSDRG